MGWRRDYLLDGNRKANEFHLLEPFAFTIARRLIDANVVKFSLALPMPGRQDKPSFILRKAHCTGVVGTRVPQSGPLSSAAHLRTFLTCVAIF